MSKIFNILILLGVALLAADKTHANDISRSVIEVQVTYQRADPLMPWRQEQPKMRRGFATVIGPGRAITSENLVRNHVTLELRQAHTGIKTAARVIEADPGTGAAMLTWQGEPSLADLHPISLATTLPINAEVTIVQFDETGQIQHDQARIIEASVAPLPGTSSSLLMYRALTSLNTGENGAPVLYSNQLAGLVFQADRNSQTSRILPASMLRRFMEASLAAPYRGIAVAGFIWAPLIDPVKRAFLGAELDGGGIEVTQIQPGTGAENILQPGDIILEWDGAELDAQGYYDDPEFGRMLLPHLINGRRRPGDTVMLTILRDGEYHDIQLTLTSRQDSDALVPENTALDQPEYLIDGGLILRELSGDYLRAAGEQWMLQGNPRLVHIYLNRSQTPERAGDHVVILVRVLPDSINIGYQYIRDAIVSAVNGQPIRNLADVFRISDLDGGIHRISLLSYGQDIILDSKEREEANQRIATIYRIPALEHRRSEKIN